MERRLSRRRVIAVGLGGIAALSLTPAIGVRRAMGQTKPETVLYVSNAGGPEIYAMALKRATGHLDVIDMVRVPAEKPSPTSMPLAVTLDRRFLYAAMRSEPFTVASFEIDGSTGKLRHLSNAPLAASMAYASTDRTGKWLLCRLAMTVGSRDRRRKSCRTCPRRTAYLSMRRTRMFTAGSSKRT
jgi:6-phosphogluconolactonase